MKRCVVIVLAAALAGACGKSAEEKQAEQAAKQAGQTAQTAGKAASETAKGLEQMAKGLEALAGGGSGDVKPVEPVSFRELMALLPDVDGWEKGKPTGEKMTTPVSFSTAEVRYTKGESTVEVKIVDSGFNQILIAPMAYFLTTGYEKETESGYEKSTKVAGQPGWERWNSESKNGEVNALAGKRFLVTIDGNDVGDTKILHEFAGKIDMSRLAALR